MNMRQAVMVSPGIIEFNEIPKPESLGTDEVMLKIERIGVCGSDIMVNTLPHPTRWFRGMNMLLRYTLLEAGSPRLSQG